MATSTLARRLFSIRQTLHHLSAVTGVHPLQLLPWLPWLFSGENGWCLWPHSWVKLEKKGWWIVGEPVSSHFCMILACLAQKLDDFHMICYISMFLSVVSHPKIGNVSALSCQQIKKWPSRKCLKKHFYLWSCICVILPKKCLKKIKENSFKKIMPQLQRQCRLLVTFQLRNHSALGCTWDLQGDMAWGRSERVLGKRYE